MNRKTFTAGDPFVPMNYPSFIYRTLGEEGYDTDKLLIGTGLTGAEFEDPSFRSEYPPLRRFIENAIELTGDPHLGARLALRFEPSYIGLPAYAAMNATRFEDGLAVVNRFFFLTFPALEFSISELPVEQEVGAAAIRVRARIAIDEIAYFVLSSALVMSEGLCQAMLRAPRVASRAELAVREPDGWAAIAPHLGFPVRFEAGENRLVFPAALLKQTLPGADPINHQRLLALCAQFAAATAFETTMVSQVVAFLETERNLGAPLATAAAALGCSERGLRRQLERSGMSYRKLVDQLRENRARELLANSSRPIQAIAYELGFDAPSNFARSFKRWTGASPTAFRDRRKQRAEPGQN